jgi:hypothetical protein
MIQKLVNDMDSRPYVSLALCANRREHAPSVDFSAMTRPEQLHFCFENKGQRNAIDDSVNSVFEFMPICSLRLSLSWFFRINCVTLQTGRVEVRSSCGSAAGTGLRARTLPFQRLITSSNMARDCTSFTSGTSFQAPFCSSS